MKFTFLSNDLKKNCDEIIKHSKYVAIDTEFIRVNTYYPKLCLLQLAYKIGKEKKILVLDVLKNKIDFKPFVDILKSKKVIKVFHAGRQDCEIFLHLFSVLPQNVFDTQIGAMICGIGDQESYENLVLNFLNIKIDKSYQFIDWSKRPLSQSQVEYAANDVYYLCDVYEKEKKLLNQLNRNDWIIEENEKLTKKQTYEHNLSSIYKKIKLNKSNKDKNLILNLLDFREEIAKNLNIPRNHVIKDLKIINLVKKIPKTLGEFKEISLFSKNELNELYANNIFNIIKNYCLNKDKIQNSLIKENDDKLFEIINLLKILLKIKCDQYGVPTRLIASSKDLEDLILEENPNIPALKGWRLDVFGNDAIKLKNGEIAIYISKNGLDLVQINT